MINFIKEHKILSAVVFIVCIASIVFFIMGQYIFEQYILKTEEKIALIDNQTLELIKTARNLRIKSISRDEKNYYVSYTYDIVETTENNEEEITPSEGFLTIDRSSLSDDSEGGIEADLVGQIVGQLEIAFESINIEIDIDEESIEEQVDSYTPSLPPDSNEDAEEDDDNETPPPVQTSQNPTPPPAEEEETEGEPAVPTAPPTQYYEVGPPPIDYYPAPDDPPGGE